MDCLELEEIEDIIRGSNELLAFHLYSTDVGLNVIWLRQVSELSFLQ